MHGLYSIDHIDASIVLTPFLCGLILVYFGGSLRLRDAALMSHVSDVEFAYDDQRMPEFLDSESLVVHSNQFFQLSTGQIPMSRW